jgi:hypothetical protein
MWNKMKKKDKQTSTKHYDIKPLINVNKSRQTSNILVLTVYSQKILKLVTSVSKYVIITKQSCTIS